MAKIYFNNNIDFYGFNLGGENISYPADQMSQESIEESTDTSIVYSFVNDTLYDNNKIYARYMSDALSKDQYIIYRQNINSDVKTYLATIGKVTDGFYDYNVASNEKYKYIVETNPADKIEGLDLSNVVSLETATYINPHWSYWSICDIDKDVDASSISSADIYVPSDIVFLMKGNVSAGSINDNLNIIKYNTLGQYGRVIKNKQKYDSGNISCLISDLVCTQPLKHFKEIVVIDEVVNKADLNNILQSKRVQDIDNYGDKYFLFPNYSSKYYECIMDISYQLVDIQDDQLDQWNFQWQRQYYNYYIIQDGTYVHCEQQYYLIDDKLPQDTKENGPPDFTVNYSQYYTKSGNSYIQLNAPVQWTAGTYYVKDTPKYQNGMYYRQIMEYRLKEVKTEESSIISSKIEVLNHWRQCVSNDKLKLLKSPNGLSWIVSVNDQSTLDIQWSSPQYPATISFNWQETVDKNKISIIKW